MKGTRREGKELQGREREERGRGRKRGDVPV